MKDFISFIEANQKMLLSLGLIFSTHLNSGNIEDKYYMIMV